MDEKNAGNNAMGAGANQPWPAGPIPKGPWSALGKVKSGATSLWKLALIGFLMLMLLYPMDMIKDLIRERTYNRSTAESDITGKWGGTQKVAGPILTVPYRILTTQESAIKPYRKTVDTTVAYAHFLPEQLNVEGGLAPEIRHRGIFDVALFKADLDFTGNFTQPDFSGWHIAPENILWGDAYVTLAVSDVRSLAADLPIEWQGQGRSLVPDNLVGSPVTGGLQAPVALNVKGPGTDGYKFRIHARLNGSGTMNFLPMGKETRVNVKSPWSTPSFTGAFLPRDNTVDANGFQAHWQTLHLSRSFPQSWKDFEVTAKDWDAYAFGVELLLPVDQYQETTRCAKYAILFILLTFLVFFIFESFDRIRIHPLQYLLVGFALCLFYLLLLALTEHIPFRLAYLCAAMATVGLITSYSLAILSTRKQALGLGAMLAALYGYLYTLLQMEDFALLMGALGLFLILGTVMFLTRRINWYGNKAVTEVPA